MGSPLETDDWQFDGRVAIERLVGNTGIDTASICIVGSMSLSVRGLRQHNDVDILIDSNARHTLGDDPKFEGITIADGRYDPVGLSDDKIIHDEMYHDVIDGFKIVRPEVTLAYKRYRNRPKDRDDIELLERYREEGADWDDERYPAQRTHSLSLVSRGLQSLRNDGLAVTAIKTGGFLERRYPALARVRAVVPDQQLRLLLKKLRGGPEDVPPAVLLNRQYQGGTFTSMDTVICVDALQRAAESESTDTVQTVLTETQRETLRSIRRGDQQRKPAVELTPSYRIRNPVETAGLLSRREDPLPVSVSVGRTEAKDLAWLREQGVSNAEIERLEHCRRELFERHGLYFYAILWPPSVEHHDEIQAALASTTGIDVIETADLTVSSMESFVRAVYDAQEHPTSREQITAKIETMEPFGESIRVLALELPDPRIRDGVSLAMEMIKNDIRNEFVDEFSEELYYCILHVTDNYRDNKKTRDVLNAVGYTTNP